MNFSFDSTNTATLPRLPRSRRESRRTVRAVLQAFDAWLKARKRIAEDRDALANMSDRELRDIGIERASVNSVADGAWVREYPR